MASFQRCQVSTLIDRLNEEPHHLIALFGPRQTGKTTIVRQALGRIKLRSRYLAVDELDSSASRVPSETAETTSRPPHVRDADWLVRHWEEARLEAEQLDGFVLVFDEIQKIDQWSETVKGLWDADRARGCPLHVVILGSAPLLMQSGLHESLAGRFESIRVTHWSFTEMADAFGFDLPTYLYFGGYPGTARYIREPDRWRDYILGALVEPNIERDLLAMTRVDKPALLKRLFELGQGVFRTDSVLHQDVGPAPGRRQHNDLWRAISTCCPVPACWLAYRSMPASRIAAEAVPSCVCSTRP